MSMPRLVGLEMDRWDWRGCARIYTTKDIQITNGEGWRSGLYRHMNTQEQKGFTSKVDYRATGYNAIQCSGSCWLHSTRIRKVKFLALRVVAAFATGCCRTRILILWSPLNNFNITELKLLILERSPVNSLRALMLLFKDSFPLRED
jgi:hypothetical protein